MKKLFAILAIMAASSSVFAGDLSFSGGVGATSNEVYRGFSLSDKNPSVNADARVDFKGSVVDVFGGIRGATTNHVGDVRSISRAELGLGNDLLGVHTELGLRENMFFGGAGHDLNGREVFVRGSMPLAGGTATAEYNKQVQGAEFGFGRPSYTSLGYSHGVSGLPLTIGTSVGYAGYSIGHKFNDLTLSASYKLTDRVDVVGSQSFGGKDVIGNNIPNQTSVGLRYAF